MTGQACWRQLMGVPRRNTLAGRAHKELDSVQPRHDVIDGGHPLVLHDVAVRVAFWWCQRVHRRAIGYSTNLSREQPISQSVSQLVSQPASEQAQCGSTGC